MKPLLQLLKDEDRAFKEYEGRKQGLDSLSKSGVSSAMLLEFKRLADDEKEQLDKARKDIWGYFATIQEEIRRWDLEKPKPDKIGSFIWMLANQTERGEFIKQCEKWDISKAEMFGCVEYLAGMLGMKIW